MCAPHSHNNHSHTTEMRSQTKHLVADQCYDPLERHVLELSRIFFVSFSEPKTQIWSDVFYLSEHVYPAPMGATLAHGVLKMLDQLRITRPHTFNFTNPRCVDCSLWMTPEERYLMATFKHTRRGNGPQASLNAMLVCEGNEPAAFLRAVDHLVTRSQDAKQRIDV